MGAAILANFNLRLAIELYIQLGQVKFSHLVSHLVRLHRLRCRGASHPTPREMKPHPRPTRSPSSPLDAADFLVQECVHPRTSQSVQLILECIDRLSVNTSLVQAIPSVGDSLREEVFPKIGIAPVFDKFHRVASRPRIHTSFKEAACRYG